MSEENQNQELQKQDVQPKKNLAAMLKVDESMQVVPTNFEELYRYSQVLANSDLVPKDYRGKPDNVVVAIQYGTEIGLKPLQAVQGIAVINGRPTLWGDHLLAVIRASGALESIVETDDGKEATCTLRRKGEPGPTVRTFSMDDARQAGLDKKEGPWKQYPKRMRQMRARAFACRDTFADILKGFQFREEMEDTIEAESVEIQEVPMIEPKVSAEEKIVVMKKTEVTFDACKSAMMRLLFTSDQAEAALTKYEGNLDLLYQNLEEILKSDDLDLAKAAFFDKIEALNG